MRNHRSWALVALLAVQIPTVSLRASDHASKREYRYIEVSPFTVDDGAKIPADFVEAIAQDLVDQLRESEKFEQVFRTGNSPANPNAPALRLTGTIKQFKAGSRAKRYMIGFGAGKTKVVAHIKFVDRTTGELLFEDEVDGKVVIGLFGGDSMGAAKGLAKEVAKVTKKKFF